MRGFVEVYLCNDNGKTLIAKEDNLIVDGAGKTIVDALTISPSLSAISSASSILDSSNYTIQAITFGAPSGAYTRNLHSTDYSKIVSGLDVSTYILFEPSAGAGNIYYPRTGGLSEPPNPFNTRLEKTNSPSGTWNNTTISLPYTTSAGYLIEDFGHHSNVAGIKSIYDSFGVSAPLAVLYGSYFPSISEFVIGNVNVYSVSSENQLDSNNDVSAYQIFGSISWGSTHYNSQTIQAVDKHGFIKLMNQQAQNPPNFTQGSGLQLSSGSAATVSSTCQVLYGTTMADPDVVTLNLYGGIFNIGLWSLDLKASLSAGNNPPYVFDRLNNPMKYRLFCKKTFSYNLASNIAYNSGSSLQVLWRIKFI